MKKFTTLFLCTMLLLTMLTIPAVASEIQNVNVTFTIDSVQQKILSVASTGDYVYALLTDGAYSNGTIGRWSSSTNETEILTMGKIAYGGDGFGYDYINTGEQTDEITISYLFTSGNEVYAFDAIRMTVRRLIDANSNAAVSDILYTLDTELPQDWYPSGLFTQDNVLYLDISNSMTGSGAVARIDLASGQTLSVVEETHLERLFPYQDGKLLATWFDPQNPYDSQTGVAFPYELMIYDPVTRETVKVGDTVGEYNDGVVYCKDNDTVYFASGSQLYSFPNMTPPYQRSGYLPVSNVMYAPCMLAGKDLYVCLSNNMLVVRQVDQATEKSLLRVAGSSYEAGHRAFVLNHPEVDLLITEDERNTSFTDLATELVTNNDMPDVITLNTLSNPLDRIYSKGYAADLSGYPELVEMISRIDPALAAPLMQDGKLYAVPIDVYGMGLGYVPQTLELLGMTTDDLPKTYVEFFDFLANYQADYGDDHPDINLFNNMRSKHTMLSYMMNQYVYQQLKDGEDIRFDTPLMQKLLQAYEQINFADFDPSEQYGDEMSESEENGSFYEKDSLFTDTVFYGDPNGFDVKRTDRPLMLSLDDGMQPIADVDITVMIVNAQSTNVDAAALYLTEFLKNCDVETSFTLYPDVSTPIPNPDYEPAVVRLTADIEKINRAIENASADNKAEFEDTLRNLQEDFEANEKRKMEITEDEIAQFHERITPYLYAKPLTPLTDWSGGAAHDVSSLKERYMSKAIDADTFIRELDNMMNMIRLEEQ